MEAMESNIGYTHEPVEQDSEQLRFNLASDIVNKEREVQEEDLIKDQNWIDASKIAYSIENDGEPYNGDDESAAKMGLELMSHVNYNLSLGTVPFAHKMATGDFDDTQKIAVRYMMDTYDKKDVSMDGFKRFAKEVALDPTTYLGVATLGWGAAGKQVAKETAKRSLMEATKLNVSQFAKSAYGAAAFEGAVYSAADDAAFQNIKMATGEQQGGYSAGQTAVAGGIGAVVAPVAMKGLLVGGQQVTKGGRFLADEMREFRNAQPFSYAPDGTPLWDNPGGGLPPQAKPQFYSQLSEALTSTNQKTWNKQQLQGFLAKQGVKTDEMKWSGIQDYLDSLDGRAKVATQDLLDELNPPQLEKTLLGEATLENSDDLVDATRNMFDEFVGGQGDMDDPEYQWAIEEWYKDPTDKWKQKDVIDMIESNTGNRQDFDDVVNMAREDLDETTKYSDYKVEDAGGTNYREELTTLPIAEVDTIALNRKFSEVELERDLKLNKTNSQKDIDAINAEYTPKLKSIEQEIISEAGKSNLYKSSHWDEENVLYHARKQDVDINGDNTLLIEEIQSDWHQEGRKKGYKQELSAEESAELDDLVKKSVDFTREFTTSENARMYELQNKLKGSQVPRAPYSKTWHEKAMKDQIAEAVEKDYDRVAWVAGKEQADRYSLAKQVDQISFQKNYGGDTYYVGSMKDGNEVITNNTMTLDEVEATYGKEIAQQIKDGAKEDKVKNLVGQDLEVGGEGMKGFYDKMLPKWTNKYIKKFGSKVEVKELSNGQEVWSFKVTDKMKESISSKGQALYSGAAAVGIAAGTQQEENNGSN